ncbi:MAG: aminopeptidase P family protein [Alphaproteobacteria bacterium]|nr:aminopeptidase P family protein [Alphaproteobacteria bacterium]
MSQPSPAERLAAFRAEMARQGLDGFLVPRADEHLGEYVPARADRLRWLTGFSGSAGLAVVLADRAAAFTDGRYVLQLAEQTDAALWERRHITDEPPTDWLAQTAKAGARIGYDPLHFSEEAVQRYAEKGLALVATENNPIDAVWADQPAAPMAPALPHPIEFAGLESAKKRELVAASLAAERQDAAVVTDPASIAWLLNIRGDDVPFTPFALGFLLVHADGGCELFMAPQKVPEETRAWIGNAVSVQDRAALPGALARLKGKRVRVDAGGSPAWFAQTLRAAGAEVVAGMDPCILPKARKNEVERQGSRNAHHRDAVAVSRFLRWMESAAGRETEMSAAAQLIAFREQVSMFRGESFPAISGSGPNGAIIHYRVSEETNRAIQPDELYLIDSGAQYSDGTTDITRTVWTGPGEPPAEIRARWTRVLKGHIALATLVFPRGVAGAHVDAFARSALWQVGLDYDHGTGHGVGSYLSVHEGPVSISRAAKPIPIEAGMILSNEPGFYLPGGYGIRLENLILAVEADFPQAAKPFLRFETLTWAPFDRRLIDTALLTRAEVDWINSYHAQVEAIVGPGLVGEDRAWLAAACASLG